MEKDKAWLFKNEPILKPIPKTDEKTVEKEPSEAEKVLAEYEVIGKKIRAGDDAKDELRQLAKKTKNLAKDKSIPGTERQQMTDLSNTITSVWLS